jgi:hypothetical protein
VLTVGRRLVNCSAGGRVVVVAAAADGNAFRGDVGLDGAVVVVVAVGSVGRGALAGGGRVRGGGRGGAAAGTGGVTALRGGVCKVWKHKAHMSAAKK